MGKIVVKLNELLEERNMNEDEFCENIKLSKVQFAKYKNNQIKRLDMNTLSKMCYVLKCQINDLISYEIDDE